MRMSGLKIEPMEKSDDATRWLQRFEAVATFNFKALSLFLLLQNHNYM